MNIPRLSIISFAFALLVGCAHRCHLTNEPVSLADLPLFYFSEYKADPYIVAANKLQGLGKEAAIERLMQLSRSPLAEAEKRMEAGGGEQAEKEYDELVRSAKSDVLFERGKIAVLCRMLFTQRQGSDFERPALGGLDFLGTPIRVGRLAEDPVFKKWPLEPIELVDGIPFVIFDGVVYQGWCDPTRCGAIRPLLRDEL